MQERQTKDMKKFDKNSFKTPEGYFEDLSDRLMEKLEKEAADVPKTDGFTMPEGYFDQFQDRLKQQLSKQEPQVIPLNPYRKYYFVAAAVAAVILGIVGFMQTRGPAPTFENLASAEIDAYFENNELGLSSYEIAEVLPIDELEIKDIIENQINDEHIIDYLEENLDDFNELNIEDYEY